jgi:hypothetical protein
MMRVCTGVGVCNRQGPKQATWPAFAGATLTSPETWLGAASWCCSCSQTWTQQACKYFWEGHCSFRGHRLSLGSCCSCIESCTHAELCHASLCSVWHTEAPLLWDCFLYRGYRGSLALGSLLVLRMPRPLKILSPRVWLLWKCVMLHSVREAHRGVLEGSFDCFSLSGYQLSRILTG